VPAIAISITTWATAVVRDLSSSRTPHPPRPHLTPKWLGKMALFRCADMPKMRAGGSDIDLALEKHSRGLVAGAFESGVRARAALDIPGACAADTCGRRTTRPGRGLSPISPPVQPGPHSRRQEIAFVRRLDLDAVDVNIDVRIPFSVAPAEFSRPHVLLDVGRSTPNCRFREP
jgi:hypothetical protein